MRLFTAIELPEQVRDTLSEWARQWKLRYPRASWVRPENFHVTLKFLGEVAGADVPALCETLQGVAPMGANVLWPGYVELFPSRGPVRVIGVGLDGDTARIAALYEGIEQACEGLGYKRENRPFRPHVTFARARNPLRNRVREEFATMAASCMPGPKFEVSQFVLMQSHLKPGGSEYVPLARFSLI